MEGSCLVTIRFTTVSRMARLSDTTKMASDNLAIVFGPSIMACPVSDNPTAALLYTGQQNRACEFLIDQVFIECTQQALHGCISYFPAYICIVFYSVIYRRNVCSVPLHPAAPLLWQTRVYRDSDYRLM